MVVGEQKLKEEVSPETVQRFSVEREEWLSEEGGYRKQVEMIAEEVQLKEEDERH